MRLADAAALRVGDEEVAAVYLGAEQVWTGVPTPPPGPAEIVLVQDVWAENAGDGSGLDLDAAVGEGNCIFVSLAVYWLLSQTPITITDNLGNEYVEVAKSQFDNNGSLHLFMASNVNGGDLTITATGAYEDATIGIAEFSGVATDNVIDVAGAATTGVGNTFTGAPTGEISRAGNLLVATATHFGGTHDITPQAPLVQIAETENGATAMPWSFAYCVAEDTESITPTWTLTSSELWAVIRVVVNAADA